MIDILVLALPISFGDQPQAVHILIDLLPVIFIDLHNLFEFIFIPRLNKGLCKIFLSYIDPLRWDPITKIHETVRYISYKGLFGQ